MDIEVTKGNPSADELEALSQLLTQLHNEATKSQTPADRNAWGVSRPGYHQSPLYNPHAFGSAAYY